MPAVLEDSPQLNEEQTDPQSQLTPHHHGSKLKENQNHIQRITVNYYNYRYCKMVTVIHLPLLSLSPRDRYKLPLSLLLPLQILLLLLSQLFLH